MSEENRPFEHEGAAITNGNGHHAPAAGANGHSAHANGHGANGHSAPANGNGSAAHSNGHGANGHAASAGAPSRSGFALALDAEEFDAAAPAPVAPLQAVNAAAYEELVHQQLELVGECPDREGLQRTPHRVAKAMEFLTDGYRKSLEDVIGSAIFEEDTEETILVKDVEFYSLCEHHMLPFFGKAHVAYVPNGRIIGLSKIGRIVDLFARRLQVQERLTKEIADAVQTALQPRGVAVVVEAQHMCMMMRGVQKQGSSTTTSAMSGLFKVDAKARMEFLELIKR